ncbi:MAG: hypothetical protein ACYS6K_21910 [Planctomycetota bacterium]|jgi:hypothetical protein
MKQSVLVLAMFLVCFVVHSAHADFYLDFETLSDGTSTTTALQSASSEYSSLGVTFKGGRTTNQPVFYQYSSLVSPPAIPTANDWFIGTMSKTWPHPFFDMDILFSNDVFDVSGDVIFNPNSMVIAAALDDYDNILATSVIPAGNSAWIGGSFHFISSTPIARIYLLPSDNRVAVGLDNLRIAVDLDNSSVVPIPSAVILGGIGLAFSSWKLRKRKEL